MNISSRLKAVKEKRNMSNQQLSELSGVPLGTINRIMSGETDNPTWKNVVDIANALGVSLDTLAGIDVDIVQEDKISKKLIDTYERMIDSKNRWISRLFICLILVISIILIVLIFDLMFPHVGYIKY